MESQNEIHLEFQRCKDVILLVLRHYSVRELFKQRYVSRHWNRFIESALIRRLVPTEPTILFSELVQRLKTLPRIFQKVILDCRVEGWTLEKFTSVRALTSEQRRRICNVERKNTREWEHLLGSEELLFAFNEKLLSRRDIEKISYQRLRDLLTPEGLLALAEKLITPGEAQFMHEPSLYALLSNGGFQALRKKWIEPSRLGGYFVRSRYGLIALEKKLLTFKEAEKIWDENLRWILEGDGFFALQDGVFTPGEIARIHPNYSKYLMCEKGLIALREKLITLKQASLIGYGLEYVVTDYGLMALREELVPVECLTGLNYHQTLSLEYLFTEHGLTALRENLMSIDDILKIPCHLALKYLFTEKGLLVLREKLMTLEEIFEIKYDEIESVKLLIEEDGLVQLRNRVEGKNYVKKGM